MWRTPTGGVCDEEIVVLKCMKDMWRRQTWYSTVADDGGLCTYVEEMEV